MNKEEKRLIIIFCVIFTIVNLIGYLLNIDILKTLIIKDSGYTIYFIPTFISLTITLIYYIIDKRRN